MASRASSPAIAPSSAALAEPNYTSSVTHPAEKPRLREATEPSSAERRWTPAQYLAWERQQPEKHEFLGGKVVAMAGASLAHNRLAANIIALLVAALRNEGCDAFGSDMKVRIPLAGNYVYPDASALCGDPQFDDAEKDVLTNPGAIFEVLSEGTEAADRGSKFDGYRSILSLKDYVLVSQQEALVEHFARQADGDWTRSEHRTGDVVELCALRCSFAVDDIYRKVFRSGGPATPR